MQVTTTDSELADGDEGIAVLSIPLSLPWCLRQCHAQAIGGDTHYFLRGRTPHVLSSHIFLFWVSHVENSLRGRYIAETLSLLFVRPVLHTADEIIFIYAFVSVSLIPFAFPEKNRLIYVGEHPPEYRCNGRVIYGGRAARRWTFFSRTDPRAF